MISKLSIFFLIALIFFYLSFHALKKNSANDSHKIVVIEREIQKDNRLGIELKYDNCFDTIWFEDEKEKTQ